MAQVSRRTVNGMISSLGRTQRENGDRGAAHSWSKRCKTAAIEE